MSAYKADDPDACVIIRAQDFRLPEILGHLESGKVVLVAIPAARDSS